MTDTTAKRASIYLRLSDLKADDLDARGKGKTFDDREAKLRALAKALGWQVVRVVVENDVMADKTGRHRNASAFKRRKKVMPDGSVVMRVWRPGFQSILDDFRHRRADALLAEDLDRSMRDPRDLEDLIDVAEEFEVNARSLAGSLTFTDGGTDSEITMARVMVAMGNKSSRDTRRRVAAARERQALAGEFGGGIRPFGFNADGLTLRPDVVRRRVGRNGKIVEQTEADVVAEHIRRIIRCDGATDAETAQFRQETLRALAAELRADGVLTVSGKPMNAKTWRGILLRDRNAGWFMHRGERLGQTLPKIVEDDELEELTRILTDPARRSGPGGVPRWLGSGLYRCGACDDGTRVAVTHGHAKLKTVNESGEVTEDRVRRPPRYRCKEKNHLARNQAHVDRAVETAVKALVYEMRNGGWALLNPHGDVDTAALRTEGKTIRGNLEQMTEDAMLGRMDKDAVRKATRKAQARLAEIEEQLVAANRDDSPLARLVQAEDVNATWNGFGLAEKRAVLDDLVTVTLLPTGRSGGRFNPDTIRIERKDGDDASAA